ncbi:MAG: pyridoxamine 5'-phosphate oxidase family protein [Spirochaetes bacterium]|nr:pyridoxamine 5'-phosphate oxidase family protein [Spirochaetota bacterium]
MAGDGEPRPMRKAKKEITDRAELVEILSRAEVLFLALHDTPAPYVIPLNFAYADGALWFHCALEGTKLDLIRRDPRVGFSAVADARLVTGPAACDFTSTGRSVVGRGTARIVVEPGERRRGLDVLMHHYGMERPNYRPDSFERTCVVRVAVEELRGKRLA